MKVLAFDLGATNLRYGLFNNKLKYQSSKFKTDKDPIKQIIKIIQKNLAGIGAIGLGVPGPLNFQKGIILNPPNLPALTNTPLKQILSEKFKKPVFLDNDANCALLGEKWQGVAKNHQNVVMLTLGTGIGGGVLIDGKIYRGATGAGAELGHMIIQKDGPVCSCGQKGCFEVLASARSITEKTGKLAVEIFKKAEQKDRKALGVIQETISNLATGIISLDNIFEPEIFIIGGGLSSVEKFLEMIQKEVGKISNKDIIIKPAKLTDWAGLYGAAKGVLDLVS